MIVARRSASIDIDDLARLRFPSSPVIAPDGRWIVYVEKRTNLAKNRYDQNLILIDVKSGHSRNLTSGDHSDRDPQWLPDSQSLVFVSDRSGSSNLWSIDLEGGEPQQWTRLDGSLGAPRPSPDGQRVAYTYAPRTATQKMMAGGPEYPGPQFRHIKRLGYKYDGQGYIDAAYRHVYVLDRRSGRSKRLTSGAYQDGQHAWSPDGRFLAFVSNRIARADVHLNNSDIFVIAATGGALRQVTNQRGPNMAPSWSPEGKTIACIGNTEFPDWVHHPGVMTVPARGGSLTELTRDADLYCANEIISDTKDVPEGTAPTPQWSPDGKRLRFLVSHAGAANLFEVQASTSPSRRWGV
jgi:acylaminoacyl-peptidase